MAILHRYQTVAFALLLLLPILGHAQEQAPRTAPEKGDWSISLGLFDADDGINFGVYRLFSDRLKLGLEVEVSYAGSDSDIFLAEGTINAQVVNWTANVGPSVWWYLTDLGPITPFLRAKTTLGWSLSKVELQDSRLSEEQSSSKSGSVALGAEWFPVRRLGVAGYTGLQFIRTSVKELNTDDTVLLERTRWNYRTFRSGLMVNFYF